MLREELLSQGLAEDALQLTMNDDSGKRRAMYTHRSYPKGIGTSIQRH